MEWLRHGPALGGLVIEGQGEVVWGGRSHAVDGEKGMWEFDRWVIGGQLGCHCDGVYMGIVPDSVRCDGESSRSSIPTSSIGGTKWVSR